MIAGYARSHAVVASLVRRLRHIRISFGSYPLLSHQDGVNFRFRIWPIAGWWSSSQRMQYCSNVVNSPHPELTILREEHPSVPHFVLNALKCYSSQTALVGDCTLY